MSEIKFSVEMSELRKKINFVRNGLGSSKTDLPVMLMRFEIAGNKATIFAASKEMFCRTEMKITKEEESADGSFTVLGVKMEKLISQVEVEQVAFHADAENIEAQAGFLTVNFELFDGASLNTVEKGVQDHLKAEGLVADRAALEEGLACAKTCTVMNSIRPDVTHVELRDGRMLSSDGRKIMIYSHDGFPKKIALKCPAATINALLTAVKNIDSQSIQIVEGPSYFYAKANLNEYSLGVRKVERSFPAVEDQIVTQEKPSDEISIDKNVLEAMLRGVSLGLPSEEVKVTLEAGGKGNESYLEASAVNSIGRRSHERASCGRQSEKKLQFPVSFKHLLDTLSVFKGDSVVDMMAYDKLNLLMVRDTTDLREVVTVIPFRTDAQIDKERQEVEALAEARKKADEESEAEEQKEGEDVAADAAGVDLEE